MLKNGIVQLWHDKNILVLITQGETILWKKQKYKIYDINADTPKTDKQYLPKNIDPENIFSNTLHYGRKEEHLTHNGTITLKITSTPKKSLIDKNTLSQEKLTSSLNENIAYLKNKLDEVSKCVETTEKNTIQILDLHKQTGPHNITPEFLSTKEMAHAIGRSTSFLDKNKGVLFFEKEHYHTGATNNGIFWDVKTVYSAIRKISKKEETDDNKEIIDNMIN